ncbi:MAG: hypothetical protein JWO31_1466 [Phycisphaerales bacterium]|nr:hypothetical protein [Phycisphaerales bacterium]
MFECGVWKVKRGCNPLASGSPTDVILSAAKDPSSTARRGQRPMGTGMGKGGPTAGAGR